MNRFPRRVGVHGPLGPRYEEILTPPALAFLAALDDAAAGPRTDLLRDRRERRHRLGTGDERLDLRSETAAVRNDPSWIVPPAPADLVDRRVEITGPPTRKRTIDALDSGAQGWIADFEDAITPTWSAVVEGQLNLVDALDRGVHVTDAGGRSHRPADRLPAIHVRPRGWHLVEKHLCLDGRPLSAGIVDAGLYLFHCTRRQLDRGSGPYLYLPKLESAAEAALWNDVLLRAEDLLGVPAGTIRVTVPIETLPAAFEMEEILHALLPHATALATGRGNYLFSTVKTFSESPGAAVLPDRTSLTVDVPFLRAYAELLVATCHRRGAHAIGDVAAFVPDRDDPERTRTALEQARKDEQREAGAGYDGSRVASPALVSTCWEVFDGAFSGAPNQLGRRRDDVQVTADDLLDLTSAPGGPTADGLRQGISVALRYLQAWLGGNGAATVDSLIEDAGTLEIIRSQIWQQLHARATLDDGTVVTRERVVEITRAEADRLAADGVATPLLSDAAELLLDVATRAEFLPFFTCLAYAQHIARPLAKDQLATRRSAGDPAQPAAAVAAA